MSVALDFIIIYYKFAKFMLKSYHTRYNTIYNHSYIQYYSITSHLPCDSRLQQHHLHSHVSLFYQREVYWQWEKSHTNKEHNFLKQKGGKNHASRKATQ